MIIINQHIPKTGSTSIKSLFPNSIRYGKNKLNEDISSHCECISFTVIRNPIDRFISCIKQFRSFSHYNVDEIFDICIESNFSYEELHLGLNWHYTEQSISLHSLSIFHPYLNVFDSVKEPKAQHLIDFNNLNTELSSILRRGSILLPVKNKSKEYNIQLKENQIKEFNRKYEQDLIFYKNFIKKRK